MTAPFAHAQFQFPGTDTPSQAAAMWRGFLIDRFSRLESSALESLLIVAPSSGKAGSYVAWRRFGLLRKALIDSEFASATRKTAALLQRIELEHELRIAMAHGCMSASRCGITLHWNARVKGQMVERSIQPSWLEALEALTRIDKLQRDLASQTGQIKKTFSRGVVS